jgi:membrane associated rhomboid family serine protease
MDAFLPRRRMQLYSYIIMLNVVVYLLWGYATQNITNLEFMSQNFTVSWSGLMEGRFWILLTSAFSHTELWHLLLNMFVLRSFGSIMESTLGKKSFIQFYLVAAVLSSLAHAVVSAYLMNQPDLPAVGASGAISGLILLFSLIYPREKILLFAIIPIPAIFGALVFIGLDIWGLLAQTAGGGLPIGHGAHLGGAFVGIIYYFIFLRKHRKRFF